MFYALCWFNPAFQTQVVQKLEAQGIPFGRWQHWIHAPSLPLALADAALKDGRLVHQHVTSAVSYLPVYMAFSVWYSVLVTSNFAVTGKW
eukprot:CAMPEP_0172172192 /NCGR_PEP_ID=MMETSP1050-20130122/12305_1 /TAXON_ID=233186 /ORGANISM="Cryptomonas curvata, Strain CCAP979/52" /LENGTH=89 /DNA_ID=CAMNT_0012843695 /DNA_START=296 /DNA_END=562 /DNA_ORIENTATION=+